MYQLIITSIKGGERMVQELSLDELKQITIDYYVIVNDINFCA